jgi:hypothetical protein
MFKLLIWSIKFLLHRFTIYPCQGQAIEIEPVYLILLGWSLAPQYWLGEMQHESGT